MSELSRDALSLIEEARASDAPSVDDRERLRQKLKAEIGAAAFAGVVLGSVAAASTATSTATALSAPTSTANAATVGTAAKSSTMFGFGKLAIAAALASVLGTAGFMALTRERAEPRGPAPHAASTPLPTVNAPVVTHLEPRPVAQATDVEPVVSAPAAEAPRPVARKRTRVEAPAASTAPEPAPVAPLDLGAELALISRAQLALREGHADQALLVLKEHEAKFASGALREERLGLSALARCAGSGDGEAVLRDFERSAPHSPMMRRVREACRPK